MDVKERLRLLLIGLGTLSLILGLFFAYRFVSNSLDERRNRELDQEASVIIQKANQVVEIAVTKLYDLRGFILASDKVTVTEWDSYMLTNEIERRFPGVYSVAFVKHVPRSGLKDFEEQLRSEGGELYKNYNVFPLSNSADLYPVTYLHTVDPDVRTLLGFDFSYSQRSVAAFTESVVNDAPTISELTRLNLIIPSSKKTGYEIVLPVYSRPDIKSLALEERKKLLQGFLGVWISVDSLSPQVSEGMRYSVYEGASRVFWKGEIDENNIQGRITREFNILNRVFSLVIETDQRYELGYLEERLPLITFIGFSLILVMWFMVIFSTLSARAQAIELADIATRDLKKFKLAVDGVSDHVIITDPEGIIVYANKAAEQITGYDAADMYGKRPSLWGGQMPKEFYQKMWHVIKEEKLPFTAEIVNRRKTGEIYETDVRISPIMGKDGEILFFVGVERDLSRLRAIERMKAEFISLASHQLRTPLSGVKWFVEMLLSGDAGKMTAQQNKYLEKIKESNEREIQLVNALLNVSRIESGKIVILTKRINLKSLVDNVVSDLKTNIGGERNINYDIDVDLPVVEIDPDLIKHVYNNLLTNAVNYTHKGGKIEVKIYPKDGKIISEVKDDGIGIPIAEQARIFEKFFRASNATKKVTEGSGLGLYLTKTIIESSGGQIWFVSHEGKGSTFKFSLPITAMKKNLKRKNKPA